MSDSTVSRPWLAADLLTCAIAAGCSPTDALAQAKAWHTWCGEAPTVAEAHHRGDLVLARIRTGYSQVQFGGDLAAQLAEAAAWAASFIPPAPTNIGDACQSNKAMGVGVALNGTLAAAPVVVAEPGEAAPAVDAAAPAA